MTVIGKVSALENKPTTIDEFYFWTDKNRILNPFDVVVVDHVNGTETYGVVQEINHITDSPGYMGSFISNDFGNVEVAPPMRRIGMNYVKAKVVGNSGNIYIPVQNGRSVKLASPEQVKKALGLSRVESPIPCGYLEMYAYDESEKVRLPVQFNSKFLIGPEGAHLNISGISGLAAKTSYAMFLIKGLQDKMMNVSVSREEKKETVAFVVINVKGRDLLALDQEPLTEPLSDNDKAIYRELGISPTPFKNVHYYYPASSSTNSNTYATHEQQNEQIGVGNASKYLYTYEEDIESIDLLFSNVDDPTQTMESICSFVQNKQGRFSSIRDWDAFQSAVNESCQTGGGGAKEITVQSWRKFKRLIGKPLRNPIFARRVVTEQNQVRLKNGLSSIKPNEVHVVDIAKLDESLQAFVFGDVIRTIYDLKLGQTSGVSEESIPTRIIIFIDELNKYAGADVPKHSPILQQIIDITERGRSLGIVLFSAEQFKSAIHHRVKGNCSTHAYGRTNAIEISKKDYSYIPHVYKNMMIRLAQGEYIVQNPVFTSPLNIKFPKPVYHQEK